MMNTIRNSKFRFKQLAVLAALFVMGGVGVVSEVSATSFLRRIRGNVDLKGLYREVDIRPDAGDTILIGRTYNNKSLSQKYNLNWLWDVKYSSYLSSHTSVHYSRRGFDNEQTETWNSDFQPSFYLSLKHPSFKLSNNISRRITENEINFIDEPSLIKDNLSVKLNTNIKSSPINVSYHFDHTYKRDKSRDFYNNRWLFNTSYNYKNNSFLYNFGLYNSNNEVIDVKSRQFKHNLHWGQIFRWKDDRIRLNTNYTFNYNSNLINKEDTSRNFIEVDVEQVFYGIDDTPEFGTLVSVGGLDDGNTISRTNPPIDIGTLELNQNIGVEIGFGRVVSGFYIYTDRTSGGELIWDIYISENNIDWQSYSTETAIFDVQFNRYELLFEKISSRFIKAVNQGINIIDSVYVTEFQALLDDGNDMEVLRITQSHTIDINSDFHFTDKMTSTASLSYNNITGKLLSKDRETISLFLNNRYLASSKISHTLQFQGSIQNYNSASANSGNMLLGYTFKYTPLRTLQVLLSLSDNSNYLGSQKILSDKNIYLQSHGNLFPGLRITNALRYGFNKQITVDVIYNSWNYRVGLDGKLTKRIDFVFSYSYQYTKRKGSFTAVKRKMYNLNINNRISRTIYFRGKLDISKEKKSLISQTYSINWKLSSKLTINSNAFIKDGSDNDSERYSISGNLKIKNRSSLSVNYYIYNLVETNNTNSKIFQLGFKTGF